MYIKNGDWGWTLSAKEIADHYQGRIVESHIHIEGQAE